LAHQQVGNPIRKVSQFGVAVAQSGLLQVDEADSVAGVHRVVGTWIAVEQRVFSGWVKAVEQAIEFASQLCGDGYLQLRHQVEERSGVGWGWSAPGGQ